MPWVHGCALVHRLLQRRALGRVVCAISVARAQDLGEHLYEEVQDVSAQ